MLKDFIVKIKVIDEFGEQYGFFDEFAKKDIEDLVKIATKEKMTCLSFIDLPRDTFFNTPQSKEIKTELVILKNYKELNENLLHSLQNAAELAIKKLSFIKIEVVEM